MALPAQRAFPRCAGLSNFKMLVWHVVQLTGQVPEFLFRFAARSLPGNDGLEEDIHRMLSDVAKLTSAMYELQKDRKLQILIVNEKWEFSLLPCAFCSCDMLLWKRVSLIILCRAIYW